MLLEPVLAIAGAVLADSTGAVLAYVGHDNEF